MTKSNAGRNTVMTDNVVNKLEQAFSWGCSDLESCLHAGISKQTLYNYQDKNPLFIDRKETLKKDPSLKARKQLLKDLKSDDKYIKTKTAKYLIDKEDGKARQDIGISVDKGITVILKNYKDTDDE